MEVINIHEKEDGGAEIEFDLTKEERDFLISYAIKDILLREVVDVLDKEEAVQWNERLGKLDDKGNPVDPRRK